MFSLLETSEDKSFSAKKQEKYEMSLKDLADKE